MTDDVISLGARMKVRFRQLHDEGDRCQQEINRLSKRRDKVRDAARAIFDIYPEEFGVCRTSESAVDE